MKHKEQEKFILVAKYDTFYSYIYRIVLNLPNKHSDFRRHMLQLLHRLPGEIYLASKTSQISKIYSLDASLAEMRWFIRRAGANQEDATMRLFTRNQQTQAETLLEPVGGIVSGWIANKENNKR